MKKYIIFLLCFIASYPLIAQELSGQAPLDLSIEGQLYPTGIIPGLRLEKGFGVRHAAHLRLGYQFINHRDLGVQDEEKGSGYGFSVGYKRYFKKGFEGFAMGLKNDIWLNTIEWRNDIGMMDEERGTTEIVVVQPTAEASYLFPLGNGFFCTPSIAFGFEVNVKTEGEPTGEGPILLLGVQLGKRF